MRGVLQVGLSEQNAAVFGDPTFRRLGLRYARGLRQVIGRRIAGEAAVQPFRSLTDFHERVPTSDAERSTLAEIGAFARIGGTRRQALWQVEALGRSGPLFGRPPVDEDGEVLVEAPPASPLPEMSEYEETISEFRGTSMTTGPHPISYVRAALIERGVTPAAELARLPDGARARIGGMVVVRQRPGTAKGVVFITLEDETGFTNAVVFPDRYQEWRKTILGYPSLVIEGLVQNREGVITLMAERFEALLGSPLTSDVSRNFH